MFNTNDSIFSSEQLPSNNCVFEMRNFKKQKFKNEEEYSLSNSFVPKTFQVTKLNLY